LITVNINVNKNKNLNKNVYKTMCSNGDLEDIVLNAYDRSYVGSDYRDFITYSKPAARECIGAGKTKRFRSFEIPKVRASLTPFSMFNCFVVDEKMPMLGSSSFKFRKNILDSFKYYYGGGPVLAVSVSIFQRYLYYVLYNQEQDLITIIGCHDLDQNIAQFISDLFWMPVRYMFVHQLVDDDGMESLFLETACVVSPCGDDCDSGRSHIMSSVISLSEDDHDSVHDQAEQYTVQSGEYIVPSFTIKYPTISEVGHYILPVLKAMCFLFTLYLLRVRKQGHSETTDVLKSLNVVARMLTKLYTGVYEFSRTTDKTLVAMARKMDRMEIKLNRCQVLLSKLDIDYSVLQTMDEGQCSLHSFATDSGIITEEENHVSELDNLEVSFSYDPRFIATVLPAGFVGSNEHLSHVSAWRLLKPLGFELVAHECRIAKGVHKPDLVLRKEGQLFLLEAKHNRHKEAKAQVAKACLEFERLHKEEVGGLAHKTSDVVHTAHRRELVRQFATLEHGCIYRPQSGEYRGSPDKFCPGCKYYEHVNNRIVYKCLPDCPCGFPNPVASYKPQAGNKLGDSQSEESSSTRPGALAVAASAVLSAAAAASVMKRYGVDSLTKLHSKELEPELYPDAVVDDAYEVSVDAKGAALVSNPNCISDATEISMGFKEVAKVIPRTRNYPIVLDCKGNVVEVQPEHLSQDLFNKIVVYVPPSLTVEHAHLDVKSYQQFVSLSYDDQIHILDDVFDYVRYSPLSGKRHLHKLLCGVFLGVNDETFVDDYMSAYVYDSIEYGVPARKIVNPRGKDKKIDKLAK
jgi:hypothetical protein